MPHYCDVIMDLVAFQIASLTIVYSTVYSDADQRKHQSSASLAFVWGIHRDRWIPHAKGQFGENVSIWWRHHEMQLTWCGFVNSGWCHQLSDVVETIAQERFFVHFLLLEWRHWQLAHPTTHNITRTQFWLKSIKKSVAFDKYVITGESENEKA